jgi:hypothetical protein
MSQEIINVNNTQSVQNSDLSLNDSADRELARLIGAWKPYENHEKEIAELFQKAREKNASLSWIYNLIGILQAAMNDKGELDLRKNPEIQAILLEAKKTYGLSLKENVWNFNTLQAKHLIENIELKCRQISTENDLMMRELEKLHRDRGELVTMFNDIASNYERSKRSHLRHILGGSV